MSAAYLHLVTNHIPVTGIFFGLALLAVATFWKSADLQRFSLWFFVLVGLATLIVYFTGEPAEEVVEKIAGVAKEAIEEHEDAALFGLIAVEIIAVLSVLGLFSGLARRRWFMPALLVIVLWASAVLARVAYLGGQIRHTEFSSTQ